MTSTQAEAPAAANGRPWGAVLVGFGAALVGMNLAVVRPMATQISSLEARIEKLASGVEELAGQTENARQHGSLLGKLVDNNRRLKAAGDALARIESQQRQLELDGNQVDVGLRALDKMSELGDKALRVAAQAQEASEILAPVSKLHEQLADGRQLTREAQAAWNEVAILRGQLLAQESRTAQAFAGMGLVEQKLEAAAGSAEKGLVSVERLLGRIEKLSQNGLSAEKVAEQLSRLLNMMFAVGDKVAPAENALARSLSAHDEAIRVSLRASEAGESLTRLDESIPAVLDRAEAAERALERSVALHARQAAAVAGVEQAEAGLDAMVKLADDVAAAGPRPDAHASLDSLADLQQKVLDRAPQADVSKAHLDQLLSMEEALRDHKNLPEAIESIELLSQMEERFVEAAPIFSHVRDWMSEVVFLEGPVRRAVDALRPIQEIADVRRMSPQELRQAARNLLNERGADRLARQPKIEASLPEIAPLHAEPAAPAPTEATPAAEAVKDVAPEAAAAVEAVKEEAAPTAVEAAPAMKLEAAAAAVEAAVVEVKEEAAPAKEEAPAKVEAAPAAEAAPAVEAAKEEAAPAAAAVEPAKEAPAAEAEAAPAVEAKEEPSVNESAAAESASLEIAETNFAGEARLDD